MDKVILKNHLLNELDRSAGLGHRKSEDAAFAARRLKLRAWQAARLARTHGDLVANPRYHDAAMFFLADLYGPRDMSARVEEVRRIAPLMMRMLPESAILAVVRAVELNALSEDLDGAVVEAIGARIDGIDDAVYAAAYRAVGRAEERARQIELIEHLGRALDALTHVPFIGAALKMMHTPAHLAGLGQLQGFLERGYAAFGAMRGGAGEFVAIVVKRERAISQALLAGAADGLDLR